MEEREEAFEVSARSVIPKIIVILVFFVGAVLFGKKVWSIEFNQTWKSWVALIFGELAYLYSFVFVVVAIAMPVVKFTDDEESGFGLRGAVLILCLAIIIQLIFWGIVYANYELFKTVAILAVVSIIMGVWLYLTSK